MHSMSNTSRKQCNEKQELFSKFVNGVKNEEKGPKQIKAWSYDMKGHAQE